MSEHEEEDGFNPYKEAELMEEMGISCAEGTVMHYLQDGLSVAKNKTVIDVGCGDGVRVEYLSRLGKNAIGVGRSEEVSAARLARPDYLFMEGKLTSLPFEDSTVGGVLVISQLDGIEKDELRRVIEEFKRVLVPKGFVGLMYEDSGNINKPPHNMYISDAFKDAGFGSGHLSSPPSENGRLYVVDVTGKRENLNG